MDRLEDLILLEINNVRTNTTKYYKTLESSLKKMRGSEIYWGDISYKINNVTYAIELVEELKNTNGLNKLILSSELVSTSRNFIDNTASLDEKDILNYLNNVTSKKLVDEVIKYCTPYGIVGISYDIGKCNAEEIVLRLLLDEGSNIRANRNLLLCKDLKYIGISCSYIDNRVLVVITYCQDFKQIYSSKTHQPSINKKQFNVSPIVHLKECDESPFEKANTDDLVNHIYNSERIVENMRIEKKTIRDKYNRDITYVIKKILYTNGDYEEIANKL
jgi:hypothetical protein